MKTNPQAALWSRRYGAALWRYLQRSPAPSLLPALRLGRRAATLGMETLDVVQIHAQAVMRGLPPTISRRARESTIRRAKTFFAEAIVPIEEKHRAAKKTDLRVHRLTRALRNRTAESAASIRLLKRGVARRQAAEAALRRSAIYRAGLLTEAHRVQKNLRKLTRETLLAQEEERRKTSRTFHDEVAQALLGVHVRLLTLKTAAHTDIGRFKKEIAGTQRLVRQSVQKIRRLSHESDGDHES